MKPHWRAPWKNSHPIRLGGLTLAYVALALLGLQLAMEGTNATAIWIPTGLAIAAVLRFGPGVWPAMLVGSWLANGVLLSRMGLPAGAMLATSLATALGNTAEALLAGYLIQGLAGTRHPFRRVPHVLQFILAGAVVATAVSALVGTTAFCLATGKWHLFRTMGAAWWLGDATGALVVTPLFLTFRRADLAAMPFKVHRDALVAVVLILAFWFGICPLWPPLAFFFFPLLVLGTSRLGPFYASGLVALLALLATTSALFGMGPFLMPGPLSGSLLLQQGFLGTLAITTLVLASALQERKGLEDRLKLQNRLFQTQSEVSQAIVHAEDRATLLKETCRLLVELGGFHLAWVGFRDGATGCVGPEAFAGSLDDYLDDRVGRWDGSPGGPNRKAVFPDCLQDPSFDAWRAKTLARGYSNNCAFPILQGGRATGSLMACYGETSAIGPEEGRLLEELAGDLGFALAAMETRTDLAESERRFRATLETVKLVAVSLASDATITFCNDHLLQLTGRTRDEVLGRNWGDLFLPPDTRGAVTSVLDASLHQGQIPIHNENEIVTRDGERRLIRWNNTILRDRSGSVIGTVSLGEDITLQKRAEAALVQHAAELERSVAERTALLREANEDLALAVEHAQAADRAKSAFLSAMSHELRTPLNSVIGFTGVLLKGMAGPLQPQQEEPLRIVQRNGRHLLDLINDVLDLSKIEAAEMRLASAPFDLIETLREAMEALAPAAEAKGLAMTRELAVEVLPLEGDRRRVLQILLNLLSNAVKFTEAGTVTLRLTLEAGRARVAVQDTGPGIAAQDLPRLFREFEQLDVGLSRRNEGTGLGLALSRRLARLMDGDIGVESQPGHGSTFTLTLPLKECR
jgi:PAS domain S-box-containing protein